MRQVLLILHLFILIYGKAQVSGRVVDISEKDTTALPGVAVYWDQSTAIVLTDSIGHFEMPAAPLPATLVIRSTGFEPLKTVISSAEQPVLIRMKTTNALQEIEVVYYTNGTEISMMSTQKVELLNSQSLLKAACCNLSESFETNPSVDVNFADAVSGAKTIQLLGLSGQYAQITKENMPYLRGLAATYGLSFIPGTWIRSIQLSKGAGSVINGFESFTGQINTELQDPRTMDPVLFNAYVNQNGRNEYNLNLAVPISKKLKSNLLSHYSKNPIAEDHNHDGFADIPKGEQINFMNKYSYQSGKQFEAEFGGGYMKDLRNGGQFLSLLHHKHDSLPLYKITLKNEKAELYSKTGIIFKKKPGYSMGLQLSWLDHNQQSLIGNNVYTGLQRTFYANYIFQGLIGHSDRTFKVGASFLNDQVLEKFNTQTFQRLEKVPGVFGEVALNKKDKVNFIGGMRADYHNYYGWFLTPRMHLRYAFDQNNVLRFSGGRALRTANPFADFAPYMASSRNWHIDQLRSNLPYGLDPEIAWNYGLNFTRKFKFNYREAWITLDAYRTDFKKQVIADLDHGSNTIAIYNLKGPSWSNTFQFEINLEPRKRFFVRSAYRFVETKTYYRDVLLEKPFVSRHRGFLNIAYETRNKHWQMDATVQYNGSKRLPNTTDNPLEYQLAERSPAFYNVLSQITYLTKISGYDFNAYLGVENLLNFKQQSPILSSDAPYSKYFDAAMVWGPIYGRMFYAGIRLKLKKKE